MRGCSSGVPDTLSAASPPPKPTGDSLTLTTTRQIYKYIDINVILYENMYKYMR